MKMKSYFRAQNRENLRAEKEWAACCRELKRLFPDMSKAYRALVMSTYGAGMGPQRKLYARLRGTGLWDNFWLRCHSAERGLRSWASVTDPLP